MDIYENNMELIAVAFYQAIDLTIDEVAEFEHEILKFEVKPEKRAYFAPAMGFKFVLATPPL